MQDFPYILWKCEEINPFLYKPITSTQRIKYTCFNVSANYIILGSTSGSIYLFSRKPWLFQQLIPLSEGAVSRVMMSPDEKTIALATTRGTVCLVTLKPNIKLIAISTEHANEHISCLCWNDNSSEVYIGDKAGKVSVMVLSIFTVNGMFQAPTFILLNLDSSIIQLNYCSTLLLVSTLTRCYVCNTIQEQYKQVGNKARNGEFGACFFKAHIAEDRKFLDTQKEEKCNNTKNTFSFIPENDNNISEGSYPKIFCARPGSRLWEVSANGIVIKTHQFREALAIPPAVVYKSNMQNTDIRNRQEDQVWPSQSINFSHLHVIAQKYLFSYTMNSLYILDPTNATVVLWSNELTNIASVDVIENDIYIMTCDNEFHYLTLCSIDFLLLELYGNKQYYDCLNACVTYKSQLLKSVISKEVREICDAEIKSQLFENNDISEVLFPLISRLQCGLNTHPIKLESGIVVVHSGNLCSKYDNNGHGYRSMTKVCSAVPDNALVTEEDAKRERNILLEIALDPAEANDRETINSNMNETEQSNRDADILPKIQTSEEDRLNLISEEPTSQENITHKIQADLEPMYELIHNIKSLVCEEQFEEVIMDVQKKISDIKDHYESLHEFKDFVFEVTRTAELYYFNTLLESVSIQLLNQCNRDYIVKQCVEAFVDVNRQVGNECVCNVPCHTNNLKEPKFLAIGTMLLRKLMNENTDECVNLCNGVPYMWREYLPFYIDRQHSLEEILRQCLQTRDNIILSVLLPRLDANLWGSVVVFLKDIEDGKCLFCENFVARDERKDRSMDWSSIAREIMKRDGPDAALEFLTKVESLVPNLSFDKSILQSVVFTKILHYHGMKCTIDFNESNARASECSTMCSMKVRDQLIGVLEKDLGRSIDKNTFGTGAHHWGMRYQSKSKICPCCTLSLQTPVLLGNNGIAIFSCGHAYHVNCMIEKKLTKCNLHS